MIILEILVRIFINILFRGIILGFFRLIGNGFDKLYELISGNKKSADPIKVLEKKYLYKEIELIDNLNSTLKSGLKGAIIEVIDEHRFFAEFYDLNGHQMEYNGEFVFKIGMNQFKLKR